MKLLLPLVLAACLGTTAATCEAPLAPAPSSAPADAGLVGLDAGDAGACSPTAPPGASPCERACAHGCTLGCGWALPSPGGVPCAERCLRMAILGIDQAACVERVATCEAVRACPVAPQ